jgi:hypothetical protein
MPDEFGREAAALLVLPPREFVAARDARVAVLKKEKRAVLAGRLKLLRRPTVPAWCVNLLAQAEPERLEELVAVGRALGEAQQNGDAGALRSLGRERRELIGRLVAAAVAAATAAGTEPDTGVRFEIESVLNAATADPNVAAKVLAGRLERAESFAGFGPVPGLRVVPDAAPVPAARRSAAQQRAEREAAEAAEMEQERLAAEQAVADAAEQAVADAAEAAGAARAGRDESRRGRDLARHAREEAAAVLSEAERRLADAERELTAADEEVADRESELAAAERVRSRLDPARPTVRPLRRG